MSGDLFGCFCLAQVWAKLYSSGEVDMKSRVICLSCGNPLTRWLDPVGDDFVVTWLDSENIIPQGHFWIADDDMNTLTGRIVVHLDDRQSMKNHPDRLRFQGCCGPSDGRVNLLCECGAEVATEVSDCWTSYYLHFEPQSTLLQAFSQEVSQTQESAGGKSIGLHSDWTSSR